MCRTSFRTGRLHTILQSIIAECALVGSVIAFFIASNYAKWARNRAVAAAIANILLYIDCIKLCSNNRSGWTRFMARCIGTMFTDITMHQPAITIEERECCSWWHFWNYSVVLGLYYLLLKKWQIKRV